MYQFGNNLSSLTEHSYRLIYETVIGCSTPLRNIMQNKQWWCIQTYICRCNTIFPVESQWKRVDNGLQLKRDLCRIVSKCIIVKWNVILTIISVFFYRLSAKDGVLTVPDKQRGFCWQLNPWNWMYKADHLGYCLSCFFFLFSQHQNEPSQLISHWSVNEKIPHIACFKNEKCVEDEGGKKIKMSNSYPHWCEESVHVHVWSRHRLTVQLVWTKWCMTSPSWP